MKRKVFSAGILLGMAVMTCPEVQPQPSTLTITGQYGPALQISAGTSGGGGAVVSNNSTNAVVTAASTDSVNFTSSVDFGDLSRGNGEPVAAAVAIRLRSNTAFTLAAAVSSFQANQLQWRGQDITDSDGGSFIRFWVGTPTTTGSNAVSGGSVRANGQLLSGVQLSTLPRGAATLQSTGVVSGAAASLGGNLQSPNNAIEIPVYVSVPSGYELGPSAGSAEGSFSFVVQFGIFPGA